jgi:hypothetical protein
MWDSWKAEIHFLLRKEKLTIESFSIKNNQHKICNIIQTTNGAIKMVKTIQYTDENTMWWKKWKIILNNNEKKRDSHYHKNNGTQFLW